jgi:hypothetical protein
MRKLRTLLLVPLLLLVTQAGPASAAPKTRDEADGVEVFARDVHYINFSTLRTPDATTAPDEPLFNVAGVRLESRPDDPVTWGEWSAATARSDVTVSRKPFGTTTRARLQLSGLVPNGLYSTFWGTLGPDSEQPLCPNVERTLPLDAPGGRGQPAPNAFRADADGEANFVGEVGRDLFAASQVFFSVVWNFSGETSYPFPNRGELLTQVPPAEQCRSSFGDDTMRHLLVLQKW